MTRRIVVVGGGVAGLSIAYELTERLEDAPGDVELLCLEASARAGGNLATVRDRGFLCEAAANGWLDNVPATGDLIRRLGLEPRVRPARESAARRFVYNRRRLHEVPVSPWSFLRSGILSPWGKLRLFGEPLAARRRGSDESVHSFASRRIGRPAARVLVDAMVSGISAGNSRKLSLRAAFPKMAEMEDEHGSLFRAMLARRKKGGSGGGPAGPGGKLTSFDEGMQVLTDTLAESLGERVQVSTPVARLTALGERGFRIHLREGAPLNADAVVLACPAWAATGMVAEMDPEMSGALAAIPSAPVAVLHFGFRDAALGPRTEGFGFLVPRGQGPRILGVLWSSDIFEGRAPEGSLLLTVMLGGAHDPDVLRLGDDSLRKIALEDLETTMGIAVRPYFERLVRHEHGIPQYEMGHPDRVEVIGRRSALHPGLWLAGSSLHGISVNLCIEDARRVADEATAFLLARTRTAASS